jgi:hypothetical protein
MLHPHDPDPDAWLAPITHPSGLRASLRHRGQRRSSVSGSAGSEAGMEAKSQHGIAGREC